MPSDLAGSGNNIIDTYIGSCTTGIYNDGGWNVTYDNIIFESNTTPLFISTDAVLNVIKTCWFESNTNSCDINNSVLVIGGRGFDMNDHNATTAGRGSFWFKQSGFSSYYGSTPTIDWNGQNGFTRLINTVDTVGFTPVYNATTDANEGIQVRAGSEESGTFSIFTKKYANSATQSDNKASSIQGYSGYTTGAMDALYSLKQPIADTYYEYLRSGSGNGRSQANFCVATGLSDGSVRTVYGKRFNIDWNGVVTPGADNTQTLGSASLRWSTVYAGTATINTSDRTTKQQIADLSEAENAVAKSIKKLFKTFKFNDAVSAKGDNARIHVGVIAQDVEQAFIGAGLDATKYALFCRDVWYEYNGQVVEVDAQEKYVVDADSVIQYFDTIRHERLGIRYDELLAFVIAAL